MPLYVYECAEGHRKEAYRSIAELDNAPGCDCGLSMKKIITPVMFNEGFIGSTRCPGYVCPVTKEWVETKRKRRNIMAKHDLIEVSKKDATPRN